jgi:hypothetical protein
VGVQDRVDEADGRLALRQQFLVNAGQNGREGGRRGRRSSDQRRSARIVDDDVVADGGHIRVATSGTVVDAAIGTEAAVVDALVVGVRWVRRLEVMGHRILLVVGDRIDVTEAAAGGEAGDGHFGVLGCARPRGQVCRTHGEEVGTGRWEIRDEDVAAVTEALAAGWPDARITRGHHDGDALQPQFHKLVALPLLVRVGQGGLVATVRDRDNIGGLVHTALQLALIAARCRVRVWRVVRGVTSFVIGRVRAVGAVNGVEEVVQEAVERVVGFVDRVVRLE